MNSTSTAHPRQYAVSRQFPTARLDKLRKPQHPSRPFPSVPGYKMNENASSIRQTFYADTESPIETISYLQPHMFDCQGAC